MQWFPFALFALPIGVFTAILLVPTGSDRTTARASASLPGPYDTEQAQFPICSNSRRVTCVVDGDTIWYRGKKIRIADIDTPEVSKPACANEARMGEMATRRLQALLNEGAFSLEPNPEGNSSDKYGRALNIVSRGGESLGAKLVDEGLAEEWGGRRIAWC